MANIKNIGNKTDNIGFLEVTDKRIESVNINSKLNYCEFIITSNCNFNCPYCNKFTGEMSKNLSLPEIKEILDLLASFNLDYLHLTGGEPTVRTDILDIVKYATSKNMRVGMSTNGSADLDLYKKLITAGVELFSISLDTNNKEFNKLFTGVENIFTNVVNNIRELSKLVYVNIGTVLMDKNIENANEIISFISSLGVADIKLGTSTHYNKLIKLNIDEKILEKHPILKYRIRNFNTGRNMRGLNSCDADKCYMALDDVSIVGKYHFPCAVYAREKGAPIGIVSKNLKKERLNWIKSHNPLEDEICRKYCMDFKCDFNKKFAEINKHINDILGDEL